MAKQVPLPSPPVPARPRGRRRAGAVVLVGLAVAAVLAVLALVAVVLVWWWGRVDTVGAVEFDRPLQVPPLAASTVAVDGTRHFDLTLQTGRTDLSGRGETTTWGADGGHLAPTLRATSGERVRVDVTSALPETSSLHWHGMHLPAEHDGGPHQPIEPGTTWSPAWTVDQPAATTWFHPHVHGATTEHVRRGVYGMFIVDDPAGAPTGLPDDYGVDDVPVMVQDVSFAPDGDLVTGGAGPRPTGPLGDELLVNGTLGPYLDVTTEAVRLRLLNASAARVYDFVLDDGSSFELVATDAGLRPEPLRTASLLLSPGERAEVVVRLEPGQRTVLRSRAPDLGTGGAMVRMSGARDAFDVLELRATEQLRPSPPLPAALTVGSPDPALDPAEATVERTFELSDGREINGLTMDMARIDEVVAAGDTEEWVVRNLDGMPHNFHVHGTAFVVAEADGRPPPAHLAGRKDTVLVRPGSEVRLVLRYGDGHRSGSPYMFHCHLLAHHDQGMMGQLLVVAPEDGPAPGGGNASDRGEPSQQASHGH